MSSDACLSGDACDDRFEVARQRLVGWHRYHGLTGWGPPHEPGNIPDGWIVHSLQWEPEVTVHRTEHAPEIRRNGIFLVESPHGWLLVGHSASSTGSGSTFLVSAHVSLWCLYRSVVDLSTSSTLMDRLRRRQGWLQGFVESFYDLADPVERGERTLVALGAPLSVRPRAIP